MAAVLVGLATWRLTSLLAHEHGPWAVVQRLREAVGVESYDDGAVATTRNPVAGAFACLWCLSIWVAPLVILLWWLIPVLVAALAASAGVIVIEAVIRGRS